MPITSLPAALVPIIQTGMLEHRFEQALRSKLAYRLVADREVFSAGIGETLTKTRAGLLASAATPLNPAVTNGNAAAGIPAGSGIYTQLDNGLTPAQYGVEQYTIAINRYGNTMDLNTVNDRVSIAQRFVQNGVALGENAARTMDEIARNNLFSAYLGGNTRVRVTLTAAGPAISVDDIRGFQTAAINGVQSPVNGSNPMNVIIGSDVYSLINYQADTTNVSTSPMGVSGVLTFATAVTVADGTAGVPVVAATAPSIIRPNARTTAAVLQQSDTLAMANILDAVAQLELNAVPREDGFYNCYLDPRSGRQLFADPDFKQLFQGATAEIADFKQGEIREPFLGVKFLKTTEAFVQAHPTIAGGFIRRPIICGAGTLIESMFEDQAVEDTEDGNAEVTMVDGVTMVTRGPLDRFHQVIAQTWYWIGGYCAPTDLTTNATTVGTATNAAYKRAVVIEHFG